MSPAVLVMARAPRRGEVRRALEPVLGAEGCAELQAELIRGAVRWASEVAAGVVYVAHDPPDGVGDLRGLVGEEVTMFPQNGEGIGGRLADASARVFTRHRGPLLIVWPDLPSLRPEHASVALDDLRSGCQLVLGPVFDGGFYLVGLARPLGQLFTLPEAAWRRADAMGAALSAAAETGVELGLLRAERGLQRPADVRAALADPCLPEEIARTLRRPRGPGVQRARSP